jgi:hypothetical protein
MSADWQICELQICNLQTIVALDDRRERKASADERVSAHPAMKCRLLYCNGGTD